MAFGDYLQYQRENIPVYASVVLDGSAVAATTPPASIAAGETGGVVRSTNHIIMVQKITLSITTHAAGKVFTVQDSNSSPKIIANRADLAAAAGVPDTIVWDFGPKGIPLTLGKDLQYVANTGGTGFVGVAHFEGYQKLGATVAQASTN